MAVRLRYLLTAQVPDPCSGSARHHRALDAGSDRDGCRDRRRTPALVVAESGNGRCGTPDALTRESCPPFVVAKLDGWSATRTPLLMVVDDDRDTYLYGPDAVVTHLDRAEETTDELAESPRRCLPALGLHVREFGTA